MPSSSRPTAATHVLPRRELPPFRPAGPLVLVRPSAAREQAAPAREALDVLDVGLRYAPPPPFVLAVAPAGGRAPDVASDVSLALDRWREAIRAVLQAAA